MTMKSEIALKQTEQGIEELIRALEQGKSETLMRFLDFQARFHDYSFRNCLLIAIQKPDATHVAGFRRWRYLGRFVKKGEKGIMILAPIVRKRSAQDESDEEETRAVCGFRAVYVFDVSQTEGEEPPEFSRIDGDPGDKLKRLADIVADRGIELHYEATLGGADGLSQGGKITLREGMSPAEEFGVLVHELAHELLHRTERRQETTRKVRELEAEAVAFVVSRAAGLDGIRHSVDYIQLYSGDKELLVASLDHIQRVSADIIGALESTSDEQTLHHPELDLCA
jgi:N-terminal domain of anti-restriction factor ArdC